MSEDLPHPRENPTLLGHEAAQQHFVAEFARGQVHHAYLMTGAKGIGKATLAYRFARHVLSAGAQEVKVEEAPSMSLFGDEPVPSTKHQAPSTSFLDMDPESSLFRRIAAGSHTDLLALHPAYDAKKGVEKDIITVEEARQVPEFLSLTPAEGLWRVVIIDAVDQLNDNAANALLKILEEPPARAMLFLVCHQPGAILPTIRSRCRTLKLAAPTQTQFSQILSQLAPAIATHDHAALYALSHGSPGYAITLAQENALKWYEGWLGAMQPGAGVEVRQKFAESAAASKSPASWAAVIHCWRMIHERLATQEMRGRESITRQEEERLAALAALPHTLRQRWLEEGARLIRETETFNLDKKQTLRMLADPGQLDRLAA
jgi:DNA polymerase-3 subunit delta'